MKTVGVVGLGHVGRQVVRLFEDVGWRVVTYDKNDRQPYPQTDLAAADLIVVCVNTPNGESGDQDLSFLESALECIPTSCLVAIRSTVLPGTTAKMATRFDMRLVHWPEYFGETRYANHHWPDESSQVPFSIVGGPTELVGEFLDILSQIHGPEHTLYGCTAEEAELIKYMENSYLAAKVTFVNEFFDIATAVGADWHRVREGWLLDPRVSRSHSSVFVEQRGFGGRCLPKDLAALNRMLSVMAIDAPMLTSLETSNSRRAGREV
ncbi:MAG: UDP-glucose/GDP-mannose dehydrogenase family protein [bacterium]|nr:UDP-glucose/GDP-mannose dehydrogenase family protein [bacterium]